MTLGLFLFPSRRFALAGGVRLLPGCLLACVLFGGCGFQPAAEGDAFALTMNTAVEVVDAPAPLAAAFTTLLERGAPSGDSVTVRILDTDYEREPELVDGEGRIKGYRLVYTVAFRIERIERGEAPRQRVAAERHMAFRPQQVLESLQRERYLEARMLDEAARLILLRVRATLTAAS